MITIISARRLIILICVYAIAFLLLTSSARAEYYIVYPAPACIDCDNYYYRAPPRHYQRHVSHRCARRVNHNTYAGLYVRGCNTCGYAPSRSQSRDFVDFSYRPTSYRNTSREDDDWRYDPDLATGDDNQVLHPDMQIN